MAPPRRKHSQSSPPPDSTPPRRKSARLAEAQAGRPARQPFIPLSFMSTDTTEPADTWPTLATTAKNRIAQYKPAERAHEAKLPRSLDTFLHWLPEGGRVT
ncbi:uncharacterized protein CDV56_106624 [Aspergillus thermomutatus]|uniref:Uncharacterized protein n=1 Tax=Aspergillus thermomutatus TaxID=41047 RepID=A0A397HB75_ASPTH|nr:uncharacterized protein CDV56_106624 [Aspergillus thermomutatus]RHZ59999.1 hypothetical protein CDV56_106624 [Aspergillus thermomutatus]